MQISMIGVTTDGFSPFPSILAYFSDVDDSNLPPHWDMQQSMSAVSPTILLEVTSATGSGESVCESFYDVEY